MIIVTATAHVHAEKREETLAAALEMQEATAKEAGCAEYRFWTAVDDPNAVFVFERWDSQGALDAHVAAPHMAQFNKAIATVLDGPVVVTRHEVSSSGPLFEG